MLSLPQTMTVDITNLSGEAAPPLSLSPESGDGTGESGFAATLRATSSGAESFPPDARAGGGILPAAGNPLPDSVNLRQAIAMEMPGEILHGRVAEGLETFAPIDRQSTEQLQMDTASQDISAVSLPDLSIAQPIGAGAGQVALANILAVKDAEPALIPFDINSPKQSPLTKLPPDAASVRPNGASAVPIAAQQQDAADTFFSSRDVLAEQRAAQNARQSGAISNGPIAQPVVSGLQAGSHSGVNPVMPNSMTAPAANPTAALQAAPPQGRTAADLTIPTRVVAVATKLAGGGEMASTELASPSARFEFVPNFGTSVPVTTLAPTTSPALTAPTQALGLPVTDSAWGEALGERVAVLVAQKITSAEIRLNPAELGPLRVEIKLDDGNAQIQFTAQHAVTRDALEQALPRLRELLAAEGMNLSGASVNEQGVRKEQDQQSDQAEGADAGVEEVLADESSSDKRPSARYGEGLVDTFA